MKFLSLAGQEYTLLPSHQTDPPQPLTLSPCPWPLALHSPSPARCADVTYPVSNPTCQSNLSTAVSSAMSFLQRSSIQACRSLRLFTDAGAPDHCRAGNEHTSRDSKYKTSTCSAGDNHGAEKKTHTTPALQLPQPHTGEPESQVKAKLVFSKKLGSCGKAVLSLTQLWASAGSQWTI